MGSWNKTCGLSNLPIKCGEPVYVVPLIKNPHHDRCYTTALYQPIPMLFESIYNDYGGGESSSGVGMDIILDILKKNLVEKELGENKYHDIAVKSADMNESLFFESVHEGRLEVRHAHQGSLPVDFVMLRKDIVHHMLDNRVITHYVGQQKGDTGYDNSYIEYKFADVMNDVPAFISKVQEQFAAAQDNQYSKLLVRRGGLNEIFEYGDSNKVAWYVIGDNHRYPFCHHIEGVIKDSIMDSKPLHAIQALTNYILFSYINSFMDSLRKVWIPGCHEGSQSQEYQEYELLCDAIRLSLHNPEYDLDDE